MPFIDTKAPAADLPPEGGLTPQTPADLGTRTGSSFGQLFDTSLREHTSVGQLANAAGDAWKWSNQVDHTPDPEFDPYADHLITGYEDYAHALGASRNMREFEFTRAKIDRERLADADLASAGGTGLLAGLAAGAVDPINLIPVGEAASVYRAGSALRGLKQGVVIGAGVGAISEGINQATRITPTAEDALVNIGASTVLFGALGGTAGAFKDIVHSGGVSIRGRAAASVEEIADVMSRESKTYADEMAARDGLSVGAAQAPTTTMAQETLVPANIVPNALAERLPERVSNALDTTKSLSFQDPTLRAANSESITVRRVMEQMADSPLLRQKNVEGIASAVPVDSLLRQHEARVELIGPQVYDMFMQYRKGRSAVRGDALVTGVRDLVIGAPEGKMTFKEFREQVGRAMARNDQHALPEVAQAAKMYRDQIFEPLKNRAIEQGLLPVDVEPKTAASYISRVYNREKIIAQRPEFERKITDWLKSTNQNIGERFDAFSKNKESSTKVVEERTAMRGKTQAELSAIRPRANEVKKQNVGIERELAAISRQAKRAAALAGKARERANKLTPAESSAEFRKNLRELKNGVPKSKRPTTLAEFVRSKGGIRDTGGEVSALGGRELNKLGKKDSFSVINNKKGRTLDDMALAAQEEGYLGGLGRGDRVDINEFLDALEGDMSGRIPAYKQSEADDVAHIEYLNALQDELDQRGIDINRLTPEQVENALSRADAAPGVANNPTSRARARESDFNARRFEQNSADIQAYLDKRMERQREIRTEKMTTEQRIKQLEAELADHDYVIKINKGKAERFGKLAEDVHFLAGQSEDDLRLIARELTDGLIGNTSGRAGYEGVPVTRGPLKERTLLIPDAMIEEYLDRDIFRVARHYNHNMATDLELQKAFGSATLADQIKAVGDDYDALRFDLAKKYGMTEEALRGGKEIPEEMQVELKRIDKAQKRDIRDIEGVRDRIRGTYGLPANPEAMAYRAFKVAKGINFMRLMGGVTISSLPDVARPIMIHGITRSFSDGLAPLLSNFKQFKLAANEARLAGTALDMITNNRALALAGLDDAWMGTTKFERGLTAMTDNYKFVSLIAPWTDSIKKFSAVVSQTRSIAAIEKLAKGGDIDGKELARLAQFGIDAPMASRMWKEIAKNGKKEKGVWWANTSAWGDAEAAATYRSALQREVDRIVVTPGQDKPLFMSTGMGSTLFQFKSFAFASTQRMLISGLQQRDMAALNGFMLSVSLGMMSYWAKTDHDKLSDKPQKWALEGVDRSGALAWFMDINNTMEKVTGFGLNPALGLPEPSRYASRDAASAIFGPTYGTVFGTILPIISGISRGEFTANDLHKTRQLMPYQNLFYIRGILDKVEKATADSFGLPENKK
jgi:hypothetical protein